MEGKKRALFSSVLLFLVKVKAPSRQACKPMQGARLPHSFFSAELFVSLPIVFPVVWFIKFFLCIAIKKYGMLLILYF